MTTALLLAAGTGSRLRPLTLERPKCLTEVGGIPILGRLLENLRRAGIKRLVIVTGYLDECVRDYLDAHAADFTLEFVLNPLFATTNNIYSLWLAHSVIKEPFLLVESDLLFADEMLQTMLVPNAIAVSTMHPSMSGTTVGLTSEHCVSNFYMAEPSLGTTRYKTVNVYSLDARSWADTVERLSQYVREERLDGYYENVFADMVTRNLLNFAAVMFDESRWCEVDTVADLETAERLFPAGGVAVPATSAKNVRLPRQNSVARSNQSKSSALAVPVEEGIRIG